MIDVNIELKINSSQGNEIFLLQRVPESVAFEKTVLVIGVFHGDEPSGEYLINKYLSEKSYTKNRLLFVPCLNPDGKFLKTRTNFNRVDLNRNFPTKNWVLSNADDYFGGCAPASEQETRFLLYVIDKYKPDLIITLHEPYCIVNYDGPALEIANKISEITGYSVEKSIGYPTPGSFGTYCGIEKSIPTITLELPEDFDKSMLWDKTKDVFTYIAELY